MLGGPSPLLGGQRPSLILWHRARPVVSSWAKRRRLVHDCTN